MAVQFEAVCGPKFRTFWDDVGVNALIDCIYRVSFRRYRPLKLSLSCEVGPKWWFLGPRFVGVGDTPDFGHAFSNRSYFRACGQFWLSSVPRAQRLGGEKSKKEERRRIRSKICLPTCMSGGLSMTNRKSTTGFATSYRWSAHVTPKSPKGWPKKRFFVKKI